MTDREFLELAAKAAEFGDPSAGHVCWTESEYPKGSGKYGALWNYVGYGDNAVLWNPLTDDGDALRLAAKIELSIQFSWTDDLKTRTISCCKAGQDSVEEDYIDVGSMRRAIVMAAADIGMNLA